MIKNKKRIAILGAGGLGACLALELSQRGYQVDLYEEHSEPIKKASFVNEGKIHLGFIYAMDKDFHTSRQLIIAALHFISNLKRWVDISPEELISTPFNYCIHKGSLMNAEELAPHYQKCIDFYNEAKTFYKKKYLDLFDKIDATHLPQNKIDGIVNPEYIDDVFSTTECSVEPRSIAGKLTEALFANPSINLMVNTKVDSVARNGSKLKVRSTCGGIKVEEEYTDVVNSTWNGLLEIDRTMGIEPLHSWSHRYKFGNKILISVKSEDFPSCTMVQGPFGDTVNFKDKGMFLSWYPIGRTGWSEDHRPPEWDLMYTDDERYDVFSRSFKELSNRIPALNNLKFSPEDVRPVGGVIYALGNTDVDNHESKLHTRHEVGIRSFDNYHSVNTGKYTLIPYLAVKVADRLEGID